ncbi:MAG: 50S ribosomal protein L21e [Candidatus Aenigmarchaeota archaeon]|nr:50S ribosomal protein L21e [Candidatus Aenigmarchaeota archaeon]
MVKSSKGLRAGTRKKFTKNLRDKFTVTPYLMEFNENDRVTVMPKPSSVSGMPHFRFKGAAGIVTGKRGTAYTVEVKIGNKKKTVITKPEHLVPVKV